MTLRTALTGLCWWSMRTRNIVLRCIGASQTVFKVLEAASYEEAVKILGSHPYQMSAVILSLTLQGGADILTAIQKGGAPG